MNSPEFSQNNPNQEIFTSPNSTVKFIIRTLGHEKVQELSDFADALEREPSKDIDLEQYVKDFRHTLSWQDAENLKSYTNRSYKYVNAIARGIWDYEELGPKTPDRTREYEALSEDFSHIIANSPELPETITTFRGTNLDQFRAYGIRSVEQLHELEGQLFYEVGFTSTSLDKDSSFYGKSNAGLYRKDCNIEVEYLVPSGSTDGIPLSDESLSFYAKDETEFLIDKDSIFKILNVETEGDNAHVKMALLPRRIWNI